MQAGTYAAATVSRPTAVVTVDGVEREILGAEVAASIPSDLPMSISGGSGITARSGSVQWAQSATVADRAETPWSGSLPVAGARVSVAMGDDLGTWPQVVGVITGTAGGTSRSNSSSFVDLIDKLRRPFSLEAMLRDMPPLLDGGAYRDCGLRVEHIVDRAIRACGFHATPPHTGGRGVSATLQGSMHAEVGAVRASAAILGAGGRKGPALYQAPWGYSAADILTEWTPADPQTLTTAFELTIMADSTHAATTTLTAYFGTYRVTLNITSTRGLAGQFDLSTKVSLTPASAGAWSVATLRIEGATWTLKTDSGSVATGTFTIPAAALALPMSHLSLNAPELARVAGVMACWPPAPLSSVTGWARTARYAPGFLYQSLGASPAITSRDTLTLLREVAQALVVSMWIDEAGVLRWVHPDRLRSQTPVRTLTSQDDLLDLEWEDSIDAPRSQVVVKWTQPALSIATRHSIPVWTGSGTTTTNGQVDETIITPPNGEDWVMVDAPASLRPSANLARFNSWFGSWYGAYAQTGTDTTAWPDYDIIASTLARIGPAAWKLSQSTTGLGGWLGAVQRVPEDPAIVSGSRGSSLPVLRAKCRVDWVDSEYTSSILGNPDAAAFVHDVGPWVQGVQPIQLLADFLANQVTRPGPVLRGLSIVPDPRLQLGDQVWVDDTDVTLVRLRAVVTGVRQQAREGEYSMDVDLRILEALMPRVPLSAYDKRWAGQDLAARDAHWVDRTLAEFDTVPLS